MHFIMDLILCVVLSISVEDFISTQNHNLKTIYIHKYKYNEQKELEIRRKESRKERQKRKERKQTSRWAQCAARPKQLSRARGGADMWAPAVSQSHTLWR
jgi:hypothetical protein